MSFSLFSRLVPSLSLVCALAVLTACGKTQAPQAQSAPAAAAPKLDSEGLPVTETQETVGPEGQDVAALPADPRDADVPATIEGSLVDAGARAGYLLPDFNPKWGLTRSVYDKAVITMDLQGDRFPNKRYVILVDMNKHSSKRRMFLFDLETGKMETHNAAHGSGSDPEATGYAKYFSNTGDSHRTSLGAYRTMGTYQGKHGLQLRLDGIEKSNSAALSRGIVVHGARYVQDGSHAGRSWGCPAMDEDVVRSTIAKVKGGAMLLIWK